MSEHDVEALLAELKPAGLPAESDTAIVTAIRKAQDDSSAEITLQSKRAPVHRRPVPAWAALAACGVASAASWMAGARSACGTVNLEPPRMADGPQITEVQPAVRRVHVESDVFVASPARQLDITKWAPVSGANSETRS